LIHLVDDVFEVDSFSSKMGEDKDIVTVSFSVHEREAAKDLMNFCEKGYPFVLDADVSTGEQSDGTYKVFIEIERNRDVPEQIAEMVYGIQDLAGLEKLRFRYYKSFKSEEATLENLGVIPLDNDTYEKAIQESKVNNYTKFFDQSMLESVHMKANKIVVKKAYAEPLVFEFIKFVNSNKLFMTEAFNIDAYPEILFLTKYIGDYNISKYGDELVFENQGKALVVKRT